MTDSQKHYILFFLKHTYFSFLRFSHRNVFHCFAMFCQKKGEPSLWPILWRPLPKTTWSDARIWPSGDMMERAPVRISIDLVQRERRHVISFPRMEPAGDGMILGFLKVAARRIWLEEVEPPRRIRRRWGHLCQGPVTVGSSTRWDDWGAHMRKIIRWWLLLLVVCLESLDSVTGTSIASWVSRNHCGSNWASSSSTRTVEKGVNLNLVCNWEDSKRELWTCAWMKLVSVFGQIIVI